MKGFFLEGEIERNIYNRRKRKLFPFIEEIRMKMVQKFNEFESCFVVDSMPLEVCKISIFVAINCMLFILLKVFFKVLTYQPASVHDIYYLQDIKSQLSDFVLLVDKEYLSQKIQIDLFNEVNIQLETPKRTNQKD